MIRCPRGPTWPRALRAFWREWKLASVTSHKALSTSSQRRRQTAQTCVSEGNCQVEIVDRCCCARLWFGLPAQPAVEARPTTDLHGVQDSLAEPNSPAFRVEVCLCETTYKKTNLIRLTDFSSVQPLKIVSQATIRFSDHLWPGLYWQ